MLTKEDMHGKIGEVVDALKGMTSADAITVTVESAKLEVLLDIRDVLDRIADKLPAK